MLLAQRGEGRVNPNPLVGALIVRDDDVIAQGYHHRCGDLHAEREAFRDAEEKGVDITLIKKDGIIKTQDVDEWIANHK